MEKELSTSDYPIIPAHRKKSGPIFTVTDSCIRLGIDSVAIWFPVLLNHLVLTELNEHLVSNNIILFDIRNSWYIGNFKILPNTKYCNFTFVCSPWLLLSSMAVYCIPFILTQYVWDTHTLHPKYFCHCCILTCSTVRIVGTKVAKWTSKYVVFIPEKHIRTCGFRFYTFHSTYVVFVLVIQL